MRVRYWDFHLPVFAGNVSAPEPGGREDPGRGRGQRGEVVRYRGILNQDEKIVQDGEIVTLIECRPLAEAGVAGEVEVAPAAGPEPERLGLKAGSPPRARRRGERNVY